MPLDPTEINIGSIAGPPFVIIILNWALFGVLSIQVYLYYQAFPNDRLPLKGLVFGIYFLEIAQTFLLTQSVWNMLVMGFGNIEGMDEVGTLGLSITFIGGLVGFLVQWFYAYRIAIISQKKIIPAFIIFLSLVSFAGALAATAIAKQAGRFSNLLMNKSKADTVLGLWDVSGSACDIVITACMCYYLCQRTHQSRMFSRTEALVSRLIRMTIETGMLTASISILTVALYYAPSLFSTSYFEVPASAQAKFYSTTMLAVLNSRIKLGIISESTTWRDNELGMTVPLPRSRDLDAIRFNITATSSNSQNTNVLVTKKEIITADEPKVQNRNYPDTPDAAYH